MSLIITESQLYTIENAPTVAPGNGICIYRRKTSPHDFYAIYSYKNGSGQMVYYNTTDKTTLDTLVLTSVPEIQKLLPKGTINTFNSATTVYFELSVMRTLMDLSPLDEVKFSDGSVYVNAPPNSGTYDTLDAVPNTVSGGLTPVHGRPEPPPYS